jgi:hypothetical protein
MVDLVPLELRKISWKASATLHKENNCYTLSTASKRQKELKRKIPLSRDFSFINTLG